MTTQILKYLRHSSFTSHARRLFDLGAIAAVLCVLPSHALADNFPGFTFDDVTGIHRNLWFTGSTVVIPNAFVLNATYPSPTNWNVNTDVVITRNPLSDPRCWLTEFSPTLINTSPWLWPAGLRSVEPAATFSWTAPHHDDTLVSAEYTIDFYSTASDGILSDQRTFNGEIDVTVYGYVPEPSTLALVGTGFVGLALMAYRRRSK
jgi:hypothetical protein